MNVDTTLAAIETYNRVVIKTRNPRTVVGMRLDGGILIYNREYPEHEYFFERLDLLTKWIRDNKVAPFFGDLQPRVERYARAHRKWEAFDIILESSGSVLLRGSPNSSRINPEQLLFSDYVHLEKFLTEKGY